MASATDGSDGQVLLEHLQIEILAQQLVVKIFKRLSNKDETVAKNANKAMTICQVRLLSLKTTLKFASTTSMPSPMS